MITPHARATQDCYNKCLVHTMEPLEKHCVLVEIAFTERSQWKLSFLIDKVSAS